MKHLSLAKLLCECNANEHIVSLIVFVYNINKKMDKKQFNFQEIKYENFLSYIRRKKEPNPHLI